MNQQQNRSLGFTLVELIVVITILAILGTIAFISLEGYSAQARDGRRISDIQNIKKSLELFSLNTGKYPVPDNKGEVRYDGELVWTQGTVGGNVSTNLSRNLNTKPTDPLTETEYTYSVIGSQTKYELLSIYESDLISYNIIPLSGILSPGQEKEATSLVSSTNAANQAYQRIDGNYNGIYVKTETYYIPTPSIINAELSGSDVTLSNANITSQIITGGPNNIANGTNLSSTGGLTNLTVQAFSGTISSDNDKKLFIQSIQNAYTGTIFENSGIYFSILNTQESEMVELADIILSNSSSISEDKVLGCAERPNYAYAIFTDGEFTEENQAWQNTNSVEPCYYECIEGWEGNICDTESFNWNDKISYFTYGSIVTYNLSAFEGSLSKDKNTSWNNDTAQWFTTGQNDSEYGGNNTENLATMLYEGFPYNAAEYCYNLVLGGKDDWYLPAILELQTLYNNRNEIGNFELSSYWSSTEKDDDEAMVLNFGGANTYSVGKDYNYYVRCIRNLNN